MNNLTGICNDVIGWQKQPQEVRENKGMHTHPAIKQAKGAHDLAVNEATVYLAKFVQDKAENAPEELAGMVADALYHRDSPLFEVIASAVNEYSFQN